ncbi:inactive protein kinase SELMODRAFT_444075-like [Andrographis paniculata]|uniref:inactive protein kinase SELMODRAFT_444075-like n=1 Tax=Andrographis paniculata TaxID=175694 RepID=UPI0021E71573|nr:inactive protein kinase SELMODRAFT_444075-like [Andrographis paniculata]
MSAVGFQIKIGPESFIGAHARAIEEEVSRKLESYMGMLQQSVEHFQAKGVDIEVKIAVGAPMNKIIVQEIVTLDATWAILDRQLRKDLKFYLQHIPCKVAQVINNFSLHVLRPYYLDKSTGVFKYKMLYSLSKPVPPPPSPDNDIGCLNELENKCDDSCQVIQRETSELSHSEEPNIREIIVSEECSTSEIQISPDEHPPINDKAKNGCDDSPPMIHMEKSQQTFPDASSLNIDDLIRNLHSMGLTYSTLQIATDYFSSDNMIGEGRHGIVYKGQLKDGRLTAIKVQEDLNAQDCNEFLSQVFVLSTVRHSNIEKLLGYSCKENLNIMVYEYICNKSLEWHLSDNTNHVLEWHHRQAIAIGTVKGLHFLHKEWWGSPFIHGDIRPSNILLTDDLSPTLVNCSHSKWKTNNCDLQRSPEDLLYLAPEQAENYIFSLKTDIYALGIVLIQLISGKYVSASSGDNCQQSLRQWALPLIETLAWDELVDPRLGNTYCMYELYSMAKAAHMCIQTNPELRPTAEEVLHLLEGTNNHLRHSKCNLYPIILSTDASLE